MSRRELTVERLHELLDYDPETGEFRWKADHNTRVQAGDVAGTITAKGYCRINLNRTPYLAHRLAVLYMTGSWPDGVVDHRNGDRACNAWSNLRVCSVAENNLNRAVRGCYRNFRTGRWLAQIKLDGRQRKLGSFKTEAEATAAYRRAAAEVHGEFSVTARKAVEPERRAA
jgi:hypothetical protein